MTLKQYLLTSGQTAASFARDLGVSRSLVTRWLNEQRAITPHWVLEIERATAGHVKRSDLRPDVYPTEAAA